MTHMTPHTLMTLWLLEAVETAPPAWLPPATDEVIASAYDLLMEVQATPGGIGSDAEAALVTLTARLERFEVAA